MQDDKDPAWLYYVFRPDGSRRVLKSTPEGNCTFLTDAGCRLPMNVRPIVCRLHPFEYHAGGFYNDFAPGCPVDILEPGGSLSGCFDMDPGVASCWHKMLYEEIILEKES